MKLSCRAWSGAHLSKGSSVKSPSTNKSGEDKNPPESSSPGNEGARGSRGEANSGAAAGSDAHSGPRERPETPVGADLRQTNAQGGGGLSSESSRSFEIGKDLPDEEC